MKATDEQLRTLAAYLQGTCNTVALGIQACEIPCEGHEEELEIAIAIEKEHELFCCEGCGWWIESSEMAAEGEISGQYCPDCAEEQ